MHVSVINTFLGTIKPGRYEDFLSQGLEVSKLMERHDARDVRLLTAAAAGEQQGRFVFGTEHDGPEEYGAFVDELLKDGEMQALLTRIQSPDNPVTIDQQSLAFEVPLDRKPKKGKKHGNVVEVHVTRVNPGGLERGLETGARALDFAEKHGARNARMFQIVYAGLGSGTYYVNWEFDDMRAWGKCSAAWATDPKGQELATAINAVDAPTTIVFSGLYTAVQL